MPVIGRERASVSWLLGSSSSPLCSGQLCPSDAVSFSQAVRFSDTAIHRAGWLVQTFFQRAASDAPDKVVGGLPETLFNSSVDGTLRSS